ncbi:MAG: PilZ domain-containing protein [Desulfomonile tiedjei]|nr:PilZ domain-containing protein [Desulfomonile tiedjei]
MITNDEGSLIDDVRRGVIDSELMEKYRLSAANLRRRLLQLMSEQAVNSAHVYWRPILYDYEASDSDRRVTPRYPLELLLTVNAMESPESTSGLLVDINEKGGCVKGMRPPLGVMLALRIDTGGLVSADEIVLEAVFRWEEPEGDADFLAGFEIVNISQGNAVLLRELIRTIVHG